MPYKIDTEHKKLPTSLDRRVKLDASDKEAISSLYKKGIAIREIARMYPFISRRSIQFILFPQRLLLVKKQAKERGESKKQYAKVRGKKWNKRMRGLRHYRQSNKDKLI